MSRGSAAEPGRLADDDERLLMRGISQGSEAAVRKLMTEHGGRLYGLLRLLMPTPAGAEAAFCEVFGETARRADDPLARRDPGRWLEQLMFEQIAETMAANPPIRLDPTRRDGVPGGQSETVERLLAGLVEGIPDRHLAVLVRRIELRPRQALVLGVVCGLEHHRVAAIIGCEPGQVEPLQQTALANLEQAVTEQAGREDDLRQRIATVPYNLSPIGGGGGGPDGNTVLKDGLVYLEKPQQLNLFSALRQAIGRLRDLLRRSRSDVGDDEVGGPPDRSPSEAPKPTPTLRGFRKPELTPSLQAYRRPAETPGTAIYRSPGGTPSTRRLSNPSRPPGR